MTFLSKIWQIAVAECAGAVRSRRALVTILLYLVLSVLAMNGTISALGRMEKELVTALRLPESGKTGIVSATIWKSAPFRRMVRQGVGDEVFEDIAKGKISRCRHRMFGRGKILGVSGTDRIVADFPGYGVKTIVASYLLVEKG